MLPSSVNIAAGLKADLMSYTHCKRSVFLACGTLACCCLKSTFNMRSNAFGHSGLHDALHCYFGRSCCTPIVVAQGAEELTDVRSRPKVFLTMTIIYTTIAPHTRCWYLTLPTCPPVASLFVFCLSGTPALEHGASARSCPRGIARSTHAFHHHFLGVCGTV